MSSNENSRFGPNTSNATTIIKNRFHAARQLPHPKYEWTTADLPEVVKKQVQSFRFHGVIVPLDYDRSDDYTRRVYKTERTAWDVILTLEEQFDGIPGPCEHRGVRNLGDGEYTCSMDDCDARFDRETARRRLD